MTVVSTADEIAGSTGSTAAAKPARAGASKPRFALLVLIGVYPLITALNYLLLPMTMGWATWQRCLLIAPVMVFLMVWGLIPLIHKRFHRFIAG